MPSNEPVADAIIPQGARHLSAALAVAALMASPAFAEPIVSSPFDPAVDCVIGVSSTGSTVAGGGDFNGDGIKDFAYGAPCDHAKTTLQAGRIWIRNGKNGRVLRKARGNQAGMFFGAALAFVPDIDGDGRDELIVGAPGYDAPDSGQAGQSIKNAGLVRVLTDGRLGPLVRIEGTTINGELGASVDGIQDSDGDDAGDLVVGEPGAFLPPQNDTRVGAVHLISGATSEFLQSIYGERRAQRFGTTVQGLGLYDADATDDVLVTSVKNPVGNVEDAGAVEVRSGDDPLTQLFALGGAKDDRLGTASAALGSGGSFIVGASGVRVDDTLRNAGTVLAFRKDGTLIFTVTSNKPQQHAQFGAAVAALGDINNDERDDWAAAAPFHDFVESDSSVTEDAGRISVLSGLRGEPLFHIRGDKRDMRLGRALAGGIDLNRDGVGDIISGNPGDSPNDRRSAGSVGVYSGVRGDLIRLFRGRHGFETRLYTIATAAGIPTVRGHRPDGKTTGVNTEAFANKSTGALSVAILDERQRPRMPGSMRVAVGTGHGANDPRVNVFLARVKRKLLEDFDAFDPAQYQGGVNVAAGDLDDDGADELVVAQADAANNGSVAVSIFTGLTPGGAGSSGFLPGGGFIAFGPADTFGGSPIGADGANVAVVDRLGTSERGIALAPVEGLPVVRVYTPAGQLIAEWLAYDAINFDGVNLGTADLNGDGKPELITAPNSGNAVVRAFEADGTPAARPGGGDVSFLALPLGFNGGARVEGADVDYDGKQEIVVTPGPGLSDTILAFEADGTAVKGFEPIEPYDGTVTSGVAIAGTDRFLRK